MLGLQLYEVIPKNTSIIVLLCTSVACTSLFSLKNKGRNHVRQVKPTGCTLIKNSENIF